MRQTNFKQLLVSDVKAPSERVYVVEGGEQENENNYHEIKRLYYGETIKAGLPYDASIQGATSDGTGYISGYGGGGVGKESMEKGGFRSEVTTRENFASAKQLRGSKMEDVIFSGTQLRKPMGYAYVAITLDNSDQQLAIAYEEVTIARRVYRSGESEYLTASCKFGALAGGDECMSLYTAILNRQPIF